MHLVILLFLHLASTAFAQISVYRPGESNPPPPATRQQTAPRRQAIPSTSTTQPRVRPSTQQQQPARPSYPVYRPSTAPRPAPTSAPVAAPPSTAAPAASGGAIDLSTLNAEPPPSTVTPPGALSTSSATAYGGRAAVVPNFRFYFDFWLISRPGVTDLSFQNVHSISMVEISPKPNLTFGFELRPDPRYYEIAIQLNRRAKVKLGRIWVPFDDMNPHNNFGGRVNTQQLISGDTLFLPNIWTDLGVSFEYKILETSKIDFGAVLYVLNGFKSTTSGPRTGDTLYPSFTDAGTGGFTEKDNNKDKAIGARAQLGLGTMFSFGASGYMQRYTADDETDLGMLLFGLDARAKINRFEFRAGYLAGTFDVLNSDVVMSAKKGGAYGEAWYRWGRSEQWRFVARAGVLQPDNRVITVNDQMAAGVGIFYRPDFIQYSIEHSRDLKSDVPRVNDQITWARVAISL